MAGDQLGRQAAPVLFPSKATYSWCQPQLGSDRRIKIFSHRTDLKLKTNKYAQILPSVSSSFRLLETWVKLHITVCNGLQCKGVRGSLFGVSWVTLHINGCTRILTNVMTRPTVQYVYSAQDITVHYTRGVKTEGCPS